MSSLMMYQSCSDELQKVALKFNFPRLKLFKTKLKDQVVKTKFTLPRPKSRMIQPKSKRMGDRPEIAVGNAGEVGRMVQPPAVKV